ncbi:MAG TPA: ATP-binding cassette domain-containing protein [Planctomycetota bacterium]|nr:ATP-binding cassette domain-containing protein [Planctomycetota bacterium]
MIEIKNLSIEAISRNGLGQFQADSLLHNVCLSGNDKEIILLLGPSGSGKSLLTNLLLGLVSPHIPELLVDSSSIMKFNVGQSRDLLAPIYPDDLHGKIGVMFQSLGLFDDLSVYENIAFANSHSRTPRKRKELNDWIQMIFSPENLNLEERLLHASLHTLSGGQKQRVAFARLAAYRPEVRILDEPTSALDSTSAKNLVRMIANDNEANLTIIITHDYSNFLPIANKVWFINSERQIEEHTPPKEQDYYLHELRRERPKYSRILKPKEYYKHIAKCLDIYWDTSLRRGYDILKKVFFVRNLYWFLHFFWILFKLLILRAAPYIILSGLCLGLVATYFSFNSEFGNIQLDSATLEMEKVIRPLFFEQILTGFGVVLFRALIPLFVCIFVAARSGTAITAYLSSMRDPDKRQWDAMATFGVNPSTFFFPQIFLCFTFGCAFLAYLAFFPAALGCLLISVYTNPLCTWFTWVEKFWYFLDPWYLWGYIPIFKGTGMFIAKTCCAGVAMACISFWWGTRPKKSSLDSLRFLIATNIWNLISVLIIFFIILIFELGLR